VQAKIIGINEEKHQVRLSMRNLFGPPEVPAVPAEDEDRDRAGRSKRRRAVAGTSKEKPARAREKVDRRFLDEAGHESLSMRDLFGKTGFDDEAQ
jgi:predicted RNA-binding protein with RPS1 domain